MSEVGDIPNPSGWQVAVACHALLLSLLLSALSPGLQAEAAATLLKFDMGPEEVPPFPGFVKVTPKTVYAARAGFGWEGTTRITATTRLGPDPLARDFVASRQPFRVDLPNGQYRLWFLVGDFGDSWHYPLPGTCRILVNGVERGLVEVTAKSFLRDYYFVNFSDKDDRNGDIWSRFVAPRFGSVSVPARVRHGHLHLAFVFKTSCPVAALVIWSIQNVGGERVLADIDVQRRDYFLSRYRERKVAQSPAELVLTPHERDRGYVLFTRPYMTPIYPHTVPRREEIDRPLETFATLGETEPLTFGLFPAVRVAGVRVEVSNLVGVKKRGLIPADRMDVRVVKNLEQGSATDAFYTVKPLLLVSRPTSDIPARRTTWYWLTLRVPRTASPGEYRGHVRIRPRHAPEATLPIRVRVLPFSLTEEGLPLVGMYYYTPHYYDYFPELTATKWRIVKRELVFMRDHGFTTVATPSFLPGWGVARRFMALYRQAGFGCTPIPAYLVNTRLGFWMPDDAPALTRFLAREPTDATTEAYRERVQTLYQRARAEGWPEILFYPTDELSNYGAAGIEFGKRLLGILRRDALPPGARLVASVNSRREVGLAKYVDLILVNEAVPVDDGLLQEVRRSNARLGLFNLANLGNSRFTFGIYPWRVGAAARLEWHFQRVFADPYNPFDGTGGDGGIALPSPDGPVPTIEAELIREGIDDWKYLLTLERAIRSARRMTTSSRDATSAIVGAEALIDAVRGQVPLTLRDRGHTDQVWGFERLQEVRFRLAAAVTQLLSVASPRSDGIGSGRNASGLRCRSSAVATNDGSAANTPDSSRPSH